jgi:hypothetical protein
MGRWPPANPCDDLGSQVDNDANAGGEGCAQLLTDIPRIYHIDLGGQRHDHKTVQTLLIRVMVPGPRPPEPPVSVLSATPSKLFR